MTCIVCECHFWPADDERCECGFQFTADDQRTRPNRAEALRNWWGATNGKTMEEAYEIWGEWLYPADQIDIDEHAKYAADLAHPSRGALSNPGDTLGRAWGLRSVGTGGR